MSLYIIFLCILSLFLCLAVVMWTLTPQQDTALDGFACLAITKDGLILVYFLETLALCFVNVCSYYWQNYVLPEMTACSTYWHFLLPKSHIALLCFYSIQRHFLCLNLVC
jgi:hypothetical protein